MFESKQLVSIFLFIWLVVFSVQLVAQNNKSNFSDSVQNNAIQINLKNINNTQSTNIDLNSSQLNKNNNIPDTISADSNYLPRTSSAIKSVVKYFAKDSIVYNEKNKQAILYGNAKVDYEDLNITSEFIIIDIANNTVHSKGRVDSNGNFVNTPVFKQGKDEYKAKEISYNYVTKRGFLKELKTQEGEGFIKSAKVKRDEEGNLYNRYAYYTTCDADEPHFYILADKIKIIPGKKAITGPAIMLIEGVPTPLAVPFAFFPLKRGQQSGLIIPVYGFSPGRGYFLSNGGYYLGLGDHADLSLTGDIFTNLSWALAARTNYNYRYRFNGNFNFNYALNKQGGLPDDPTYNQFKTFQLDWNHRMDGKARPGTNFGANVRLAGNRALAFNNFNINQNINNQLNSSITFSKSFSKGKYNLSANARASQNTQTRDLFIQLPDVTFTMPSFQPFKSRAKPTAEKWFEKISVNYTGLFQNNINTKDSLLLRPRSGSDFRKFTDSTFRYGFRHDIPIQTSFNLLKFYTVSFGANYNETWTFNTIRRTFNTNTKREEINRVNEFARGNQYNFRTGITTRYYGLVNFRKSRVAAVRHVLNPNLDFTYVPDFSKTSYGFYRDVQVDTLGRTRKYSIFEQSLFGGPGVGRQGNIGFGADNNFEMKWRKKDSANTLEKIKLIESLRLFTSYNIFADSLNLAPISISGLTTLFKAISINGNATVDPYYNQVVETGFGKQIIRRNQYYLSKEGSLGKLTNASMGLNWSINQATFENKEAKEQRKKRMLKNGFEPIDVSWSLNINYTLAYDYRNKLLNTGSKSFNQTLSFSGSFNPTKNWFINYNSGYDFVANKISHLGIDLRRDLHCWQFTFNWTPLSAFGVKYFFFQINVKSSVLQDLKIPKRRSWFD
ncbi:MAG: putative LPS assembly protein LptD [Bacteroidia bacterium]